MVTCSKCGARVVGDAIFCVKCSAPLRQTHPPAGAIYCARCGQLLPHINSPEEHAVAQMSRDDILMPVQYASPMTYVFGWVSGIAMYFMDKRPAVRFHAVQSVVVFGVLNILGFIAGRLSRNFFVTDFQQTNAYIAFAAFAVVVLVSLILWILLIVKSFEKKPMRIFIAASIADHFSGKTAAKAAAA
jgi:uncharacterized membrane protein